MALAFAGFCAYTIIDRALTVFPSPETESAFLKKYNPKSVVDQFQIAGRSSGWGTEASSGANRGFADNHAAFDSRFSIKAEDWLPFMKALGEDLTEQLERHGARIMGKNGDARRGFQVYYVSGRAIGSVVISPLAVEKSALDVPGKVSVELKISADEKWYRKDQGLVIGYIQDSKHQPRWN